MKEKTLAKEIQEHLQKEIPELYPQRFKDYNVVSVNYDVILEDIKTYWEQDARFREGFRYDDETKTIYIPNFFTKINGIHKNKKEYVEFVRFLRNSKNTYILNKNEKTKNVIRLNTKLEKELENKNIKEYSINDILFAYDKYENCFEPTIKNILQGYFLCFELCNPSDISFDYLTTDKKNLLLSILIKRLKENIFEFSTIFEYKEYINLFFSLNECYINLINNFDYSLEIPKIVVTKETISKSESQILDLLNEIGFDILILSPYGKSNIEKYIDINELSLGYFDTKFDFEKESLSLSEQIKINNEKKKDKIIDFYNKKHLDECWTGIIPGLISIICLFLVPWGWINTIIEIFCLIIAIIFICGISDTYHITPSTISWSHGLAITLISLMLICRGGVALYDIESNPQDKYMNSYKGFQNIEDDSIILENGFVIKTKKDALIKEDSTYINTYIENNSSNIYSIIFEVLVGNKVVYISSELEPLTYVKGFNINTYIPLGSHTLTIKYYKSDTYDEYENNNECLGSNEIIVHVVSEEDYDKSFKEYKLID